MPARGKIAQLSDDLRADVDRRLTEGRFSHYQDICDWLAERGVEVSHMAVWRYGQQLQATRERMEMVRVATRQAEAVVEAAGDEPALARANGRLIQDSLLRLALGEELDADEAVKLSLAHRRAVEADRVLDDMERRRAEAAADAAKGVVDRVEAGGGLDPATAAALRRGLEQAIGGGHREEHAA